MGRSWCILLIFLFFTCGNNNTGPELEPEPEPEPEPVPQYKEISYENLVGGWPRYKGSPHWSYHFYADSSFVEKEVFRFYFSGKYLVNDPYIAVRGREISGTMQKFFFDKVRFLTATIIVTEVTDTISVSPLDPEQVVTRKRTLTILTLRRLHLFSYKPGDDSFMSIEAVSSFLDSLKQVNANGVYPPGTYDHVVQFYR